MTSIKILSIVVLYEQDVLNCSTISSMILLNKRLKNCIYLVVYDNSENCQKEKDINVLSELFTDFAYVYNGYNTPLSVLYNNAINSYGNLCTHINIWDQDSFFTDEYYEQCLKTICNHDNTSLIIPRIFVGDKLVSPGIFKRYKGKYLKHVSIGFVECKKEIIGVMSGVLINKNVFERIRFDERFKFYGIDTKFFIDYCHVYTELYVLEYVLKHNLSVFNNTESIALKKFRFRDFCSSIILLSENNGFLERNIVRLYLLFVALKKEDFRSRGTFMRIALGF
jgi:hypothetical protein